MGCDGIWEVKSTQEMIDFVRERLEKKLTPKKILEELLDSILASDTTSKLIKFNYKLVLDAIICLLF